jgi:transcriptional regulator with XRE-family HTH domain
MELSDTDEKTLGETLRKLRTWKHLSQKDVGEQLGIGERQYGRMEKGEAPITWPVIEKAAEMHGMSPADLISFHDRVTFNNCDHAHAYGHIEHYYTSSKIEREQFEARIRNLEEEVAFLREQNMALLQGHTRSTKK